MQLNPERCTGSVPSRIRSQVGLVDMYSEENAVSEIDEIADGNSVATAPTAADSEPEQPSVLKQVEQRTKRRRRSQPPGWTIWVAGQAGRSRTFLSHTLPVWLMNHREELISYATSSLIMATTALLMALWVLPPDSTAQIFGLLVTAADVPDEQLEAIEILETVQPESIQDLNLNSNMKQLLSDLNTGDTADQMHDIEDKDFELDLEPTDAEMETVYKQGEFGGRSDAGRQASLKKFGGTADSEKAVSSGLNWLKKIQQKDGSWSFANQGPGAAAGGFRRTEVGATSLALLCFLGAGHTHVTEGPYRETVETGLAYIGSQAEIIQGTADLRGRFEGNSGMYVQGLATICISEAHALEHRDKDLEKLTEMAVNFIERAQDPVSGGWRYRPRDDTSDTSVVGWQIMAIQSAKAGRIRVSSKPLREAKQFLRSVQVDKEGGLYAYVPGQGDKDSMTAVGLLCRMYLGWRHDHEGLQKGVQHLAAIGPSRNNIYYNYYATQVLHHWGGDLWEKWNLKMREQLVRTQIKDGPAAGSWPVTDPHGNAGGQIYQTTLSILTLEVYYRHLPIYRKLEETPADPTQVSDR